MIFGLEKAGQAKAVFDSAAGGWMSRARLAEDVLGLAQTLSKRRPGLIFVFTGNNYASIAVYLAALEAARPVALFDARLDPEFKERLIERYQPELVFQPGREGFFKPPLASIESLGPGYNAWALAQPGGAEPHPDLALLLSTSGSTGSPKLVRLSRANLESNAQAIVQALSLNEGERPLTSLPIHYSYGLSVLNSHLVAGAGVVLTDEGLMSRGLWDTFRERECTSLAAVPFGYQVLDRIGFLDFDLPTLKTMTQAGGRLGEKLAARFHEGLAGRGVELRIMYGQTEATARIAVMPSGALPEKLGAAGRVVQGGRLSIETERGETTRPGVSGQVIYRGPNVMLGYAQRRQDLARGDENQGRLATGDLGLLDEDGFLHLTGRIKRIAKVFGLRVNLDEMEELCAELGPVAVLGAGDKLVVFHQAAPELARAFGRRLAQRLRLPPTALNFRVRSALPLGSNGKVDYPALEREV